MAALIHLDTHVVVWLGAGEHDRLSKPAMRALDGGAELAISPMVLLELSLLQEVGRLSAAADELVDRLAADIGLRVAEHRFGALVEAARSLTWTRDPFDRMIVAHASVAGVPLLTADETIRSKVRSTIW